ncbi:MAG: hypothetical protein GX442_16570 [Candidatus Riflebacteria bacterium]|nr:hypothetical protein [Candidatus Riflebacteria bacterium]
MGGEKKVHTMCGLGKDLKGKALAEFVEVVRKPRFYCERCHRVARRKKNLCQPVRLPKP